MNENFFGIGYELTLVALSLLLGAVLGSWFDVLRALRRTFRHSRIAVFFEDIVFALIFGLCYYSFCLMMCDGALRGFVLASMLAGFLLYIYTIGIIISDFFTMTLTAVVKIIKKCIALLCGVLHFVKRKEKIDETP